MLVLALVEASEKDGMILRSAISSAVFKRREKIKEELACCSLIGDVTVDACVTVGDLLYSIYNNVMVVDDDEIKA